MENREWKEYKIKDVGTVITGKTPSKNNPEDWGDEMPFVTPSDYKHYRKFAKFSDRNLSSIGIERLKSKVLPINSILVTCIGSDMGKIVINKCSVITNQQINSIIHNNNINSDFLYYRLISMYETLRIYGGDGTAVPIVNKGDFENLEIQLPPLPEQKAIASVLSSLDDKIDLLHQQNQTLESLAETLFRQWFINYSENQNEPKKETEIGNVPESFNVVQIKDLDFVLETGKRPKGGVGTLTSGVPSIGAENIKGLGMYDHSKTKYISQEFADTMNRGHIKGYELLIYKDGGTPGHFIPRYSIFGNGFPFDTMTINEHVFKLDFNDKAFNFFCYFYFQTDLVDSILVANGAKAAIPGINQDDVKNLWIIHPETPLIKKFGDLTLPYLEKILFNCNQIQTLTQLRDTLLPKLMSGDVRVKN